MLLECRVVATAELVFQIQESLAVLLKACGWRPTRRRSNRRPTWLRLERCLREECRPTEFRCSSAGRLRAEDLYPDCLGAAFGDLRHGKADKAQKACPEQALDEFVLFHYSDLSRASGFRVRR